MANDITLTQPDLIERLLAGLPAGYTEATVKLPNFSFTTPKDTKWMRGTVLFNETNNVTPDGYQRTFGFFVVDIFFPKSLPGDKAQLADAKEIQVLFNNQEFGNTRTQASSIVPAVEDEAWYKIQINTEFIMEGVL